MIDRMTYKVDRLQYRSIAGKRQPSAMLNQMHHDLEALPQNGVRPRVEAMIDVGACNFPPVGKSASTPIARDLVDESPNGPLKDVDKNAAHMNLNLTDEVILDSVQHALNLTGLQQLKQLQAYCHGGRVTLQGSLPTYYLKQLAQSVIRSLAGVQDIDNDVKVVSSW